MQDDTTNTQFAKQAYDFYQVFYTVLSSLQNFVELIYIKYVMQSVYTNFVWSR